MTKGIDARRLWRLAFLVFVLYQALALGLVGNDLLPRPMGDPYAEADAVRSSQYYVEHGLSANAGLPVIVHGSRFADEGWLGELRHPSLRRRDATELPRGVYTRYPPLPNWICAIAERLFGFERLWMWRLFPIAVAVAAILVAARLLTAAFGVQRGALVSATLMMLPLSMSHAAGLHFQGYAHSLLLLQIALVTADLWRFDGVRARTLASLGVCAFLQGYLSFDYAFLVAFASIPLWLLRRADGGAVASRSLVVPVVVAGAAFTLAHLIHFGQVVAFYGDLHAAVADLAGRARFRALGEGADGGIYPLVSVMVVMLVLVKHLMPLNVHLGPMLLVLLVLLIGARGPRGLRIVRASHERPGVRIAGVRRFYPAIGAAFLVGVLWYAVMPAMTLRHLHIVPRHLFLPVAVATIAVGLSVRREHVTVVTASEPAARRTVGAINAWRETEPVDHQRSTPTRSE